MKPTISTSAKILMLHCAAWALGSAGMARAASDEIPDLSRVWQFGQCIDGTGMRCLIMEAENPLLTDRARALRDALDEVAQPKYDCAPMSIPHMWTDPYSHQIEQFDDRVVFTYGKDDVVRTAWLPGSDHPEPNVNEFFYFGHSHARYEGGALIVETDRFTFDPQGLNADFKLASSTQKKVTERYTKEGEDLILEVTTTDTFFLNQPWTYKVRSRPDPEELALPWACDLEGARETLKLLPSSYPQDPPVERLQY